MIKNLWSNVELYCGYRHEEPIKMEIQQGATTVFYACPKYHEENREEEERACRNFLYLNEYEKMLKKISDTLYKSEMENIKENLENYKWSENGVDFEIFYHKGDDLRVKMINRKSINGKG